MAWIKMRHDLAEDPAVIGIASRLGLSTDEVVGKLHRLWSWADRQTEDGRVRNVSASWTDNYVGAPGFAHAMSAEKWLVCDVNGGIRFPNFDRHNGASAKRRDAETLRKRASRERPQPVRKVSATNADKKRLREEKRRVEKKSTTPNGVVRRGTRLDDETVLTDEWRKIAREESVPDAEVGTVFREFVGYWTALPGQKACKLDWTKTWRNQCIKQAPRFRPRERSPDKPAWQNSRAAVEPTRGAESNVLTSAADVRAGRERIRKENEEREREERALTARAAGG